MNKTKYILFDRDGTLTKRDKHVMESLNNLYKLISGKELNLPFNRFLKLYNLINDSGVDYAPYKTVEDEIRFFKDFYKRLLEEDGINHNLDIYSKILSSKLWHAYYTIYPDTIITLEYLKKNDYKIIILCDAPPSLEFSFTLLGLEDYIFAYFSSSCFDADVGDGTLFDFALERLSINSRECIYVSDSQNEVEVALAKGIKAYLIDRNKQKDIELHSISSLSVLINLLENQNLKATPSENE